MSNTPRQAPRNPEGTATSLAAATLGLGVVVVDVVAGDGRLIGFGAGLLVLGVAGIAFVEVVLHELRLRSREARPHRRSQT